MDTPVLKKRDVSYDIIRIIALFFVISVHFLFHSPFYEQLVLGRTTYFLTLARTLFICCVPLFVTLSGCLMNKKTINRPYYLSIGKNYFVYCIGSFFCFVYRLYRKRRSLSVTRFLFESVIGILNFSSAPYSWYMNMYIGLFLMIPFLNIIYRNLSTRNEKRLLLLTCFLLFSAPTIANSFSYYGLLPAWWTGAYPLGYYFLGCYLSEYRPKVKPSLAAAGLGAAVILFGTYVFWRYYGGTFDCEPWSEYSSPFTAVLTILMFLFWMNVPLDNLPARLKAALAGVSNSCLGAYVVSWIFEMQFYPENLGVLSMTESLPYFLYVPLVFCCSLAVSYIINKMYDCFFSVIIYGKRRIMSKIFSEKNV